ncbi:MAG TPA: NnrS family protein [Magnetovibrio sp.]
MSTSSSPILNLDDPRVPKPEPIGGLALFNYGFRPFFLAAGAFAVLSVGVWLLQYAGHVDLRLVATPALWHAHEMLFGYTMAAVAGFFLTVVPNWTRAKAQKGLVLMVLTALWLVGRVVMWGQAALPYGLVMAGDMLFLVALSAVVARPLLNPQHRRQFVFVPILVSLVAANAMMHLDVLEFAAFGIDWGGRGVMLGLDATVVLIAVMGGRVTPSFTSSFIGHADPSVKVQQRPILDRAVMIATWAVLVVDLVWPQQWLGGSVALMAAALHLARLAGWQSMRTLGNPILWVLHLGYLWLVAGLAMKGLADFSVLVQADALHALTIGAIGTMTMAIMTRASLGHTGRAIHAGPVIVAAYGLLSVAALARLAVMIWPDAAVVLVLTSGVAWILAFGIFVAIYAPILIQPRIDGRPG